MAIILLPIVTGIPGGRWVLVGDTRWGVSHPLRMGCRHQTGLGLGSSDMGRPARRALCEAGSLGRPATRAERRKAAAVAAAAAQAVVVPAAGLVPAEPLLVELPPAETAGRGEPCSAQLMSGGMQADHKAPVEADQAPQE